MSIILIVGFILIIISPLYKKQRSPYWGMLFVLIIMGLQEGVKGDFMVYKSFYEGGWQITTTEDEPVWNFLQSFFSSYLSFGFFILVLSSFQCWVLWKVGNRFGSKQYGFLGPILFFFTFNLMLLQMKAIREGLAVEVCVLAYYLIAKNIGVIWSITFIIISFFIHNSAIAIAPFIILQIVVTFYKGMDNDSLEIDEPHVILFPIIMTTIYIVVYSMKEWGLMQWLDQLALLAGEDFRIASYLTKDQQYIGDSNISPLLILYNGIMVFLCSWFFQRADRRYKILAIASIVSCFGEMLLVGLGTLPRILMYYSVFNILTYPKLTELIARKFGKPYAVVLMGFLLGYAIKTSSYWMTISEDDRFGTYYFVFMDWF